MDFRAQQAANVRKTYVLLVAMFALLTAAVWALAHLAGVGGGVVTVFAVVVSLAAVWGSYWNADRIVLAMTRARVIDHAAAPQLYNLVEELTLAAGLPLPTIAIVDDPAPNAFATGRSPDRAVIAFTTGLLNLMDREQLQGVAAHELAHVANRDTLVATVAATTAGMLAILSDIGSRLLFFGGGKRRDAGNPVMAVVSIAVVVLAPVGAALLKAAVSRRREALADATAVSFTRNPAGLRRALEALEQCDTVVTAKSDAVAHLWIESPLDGKSKSLFDTHPPLATRIDALRTMEALPPR